MHAGERHRFLPPPWQPPGSCLALRAGEGARRGDGRGGGGTGGPWQQHCLLGREGMNLRLSFSGRRKGPDPELQRLTQRPAQQLKLRQPFRLTQAAGATHCCNSIRNVRGRCTGAPALMIPAGLGLWHDWRAEPSPGRGGPRLAGGRSRGGGVQARHGSFCTIALVGDPQLRTCLAFVRSRTHHHNTAQPSVVPLY